jgi:hypothetical protein
MITRMTVPVEVLMILAVAGAIAGGGWVFASVPGPGDASPWAIPLGIVYLLGALAAVVWVGLIRRGALVAVLLLLVDFLWIPLWYLIGLRNGAGS